VSPRPAEFKNNPFDAALRHARAGAFVNALDTIASVVAAGGAREAVAPAAANALAEVAAVAEHMGDLGAAERAIAAAVELRPRYPDLHYRRGCLLIRCGRRDEARRALDAALALNPRYLAARLERAMLDARAGLVGEALESLRALSGDQPVGDPRAFQRGLKSLERADWEAADSLLRHALQIPDEPLQRRLERIREQVEAGHAVDATTALRELVSGHPGYPDLYALLGRAELALGHVDDAILALSRALELHPDYHAARVLLAQALECLGQVAAAQDQITLVLEVDPKHLEALETRRRWERRATPAGRARSGER
jgi:tetratricopeptide (TPR) repeat protein